MKKLYILSLALASAISFASCNKNPGGGGGGGEEEQVTKEEFESTLHNDGVEYLQIHCKMIYDSTASNYTESTDISSIYTKISPTLCSEIMLSEPDPSLFYYEQFYEKIDGQDSYLHAIREEFGGSFGTKTETSDKPTPQSLSAYASLSEYSAGEEPFSPTFEDFEYKDGKYICNHAISDASISITMQFKITIEEKKISCLEIRFPSINSFDVINLDYYYTYNEVEVPIPEGWNDSLL